MAYMKWPGPYIVKYAFDIDLEVARSFPGAVHEQVTDILVDQGWKHSFFFIIEQAPAMMTLRSTGSRIAVALNGMMIGSMSRSSGHPYGTFFFNRC